MLAMAEIDANGFLVLVHLNELKNTGEYVILGPEGTCKAFYFASTLCKDIDTTSHRSSVTLETKSHVDQLLASKVLPKSGILKYEVSASM